MCKSHDLIDPRLFVCQMKHPAFTMVSPSESLLAVEGSTDEVDGLRTHRDISKVKCLSTVVEMTVDRLSVGGTVPSPTTYFTTRQGRRVFSLSRKNKQLLIGGCQFDLS